MLTLAAIVFLAGSPLLSFDAAELPYFNPQGSDRTSLNYRYHGSGSIPRELGKKLLTQEIRVLGADTFQIDPRCLVPFSGPIQLTSPAALT